MPVRPVKGLMLIEATDRHDYASVREKGYDAYVTPTHTSCFAVAPADQSAGKLGYSAPRTKSAEFCAKKP